MICDMIASGIGNKTYCFRNKLRIRITCIKIYCRKVRIWSNYIFSYKYNICSKCYLSEKYWGFFFKKKKKEKQYFKEKASSQENSWYSCFFPMMKVIVIQLGWEGLEGVVVVVWLGFFPLFLLTLFALHRDELFPHFRASSVVDFS